MLRIQLVFEFLIIASNCLANLSLHFHISHVYTTDFWTTESVASSNFGLALSALFIIPYHLLVEKVKSSAAIKDVQATTLCFHIIFCIIYNAGFSLTYAMFVGIVTGLTMGLGSLLFRIIEQRKLHSEILQIENEDRKTLSMGQSKRVQLTS